MNLLGCNITSKSAVSCIFRNRKLYQNAIRNSAYYVHPEHLMHIHRQRQAHNVCNYLDSDRYKNFLVTLGNVNDQLIEDISSGVKKQVRRYERGIMAKKSETHRKPEDSEEVEFVLPLKKNVVRTNVLSAMLKKKKALIEKEVVVPKKIQVKNKSTITPIVLDRKKKTLEDNRAKRQCQLKMVPMYVKRMQKFRKIQDIRQTLKVLDTLRPKSLKQNKMPGFIDTESLRGLNLCGKSLDEVTSHIWDTVSLKSRNRKTGTVAAKPPVMSKVKHSKPVVKKQKKKVLLSESNSAVSIRQYHESKSLWSAKYLNSAKMDPALYLNSKCPTNSYLKESGRTDGSKFGHRNILSDINLKTAQRNILTHMNFKNKMETTKTTNVVVPPADDSLKEEKWVKKVNINIRPNKSIVFESSTNKPMKNKTTKNKSQDQQNHGDMERNVFNLMHKIASNYSKTKKKNKKKKSPDNINNCDTPKCLKKPRTEKCSSNKKKIEIKKKGDRYKKKPTIDN